MPNLTIKDGRVRRNGDEETSPLESISILPSNGGVALFFNRRGGQDERAVLVTLSFLDVIALVSEVCNIGLCSQEKENPTAFICKR